MSEESINKIYLNLLNSENVKDKKKKEVKEEKKIFVNSLNTKKFDLWLDIMKEREKNKIERDSEEEENSEIEDKEYNKEEENYFENENKYFKNEKSKILIKNSLMEKNDIISENEENNFLCENIFSNNEKEKNISLYKKNDLENLEISLIESKDENNILTFDIINNQEFFEMSLLSEKKKKLNLSQNENIKKEVYQSEIILFFLDLLLDLENNTFLDIYDFDLEKLKDNFFDKYNIKCINKKCMEKIFYNILNFSNLLKNGNNFLKGFNSENYFLKIFRDFIKNILQNFQKEIFNFEKIIVYQIDILFRKKINLKIDFENIEKDLKDLNFENKSVTFFGFLKWLKKKKLFFNLISKSIVNINKIEKEKNKVIFIFNYYNNITKKKNILSNFENYFDLIQNFNYELFFNFWKNLEKNLKKKTIQKEKKIFFDFFSNTEYSLNTSLKNYFQNKNLFSKNNFPKFINKFSKEIFEIFNCGLIFHKLNDNHFLQIENIFENSENNNLKNFEKKSDLNFFINNNKLDEKFENENIIESDFGKFVHNNFGLIDKFNHLDNNIKNINFFDNKNKLIVSSSNVQFCDISNLDENENIFQNNNLKKNENNFQKNNLKRNENNLDENKNNFEINNLEVNENNFKINNLGENENNFKKNNLGENKNNFKINNISEKQTQNNKENKITTKDFLKNCKELKKSEKEKELNFIINKKLIQMQKEININIFKILENKLMLFEKFKLLKNFFLLKYNNNNNLEIIYEKIGNVNKNFIITLLDNHFQDVLDDVFNHKKLKNKYKRNLKKQKAENFPKLYPIQKITPPINSKKTIGFITNKNFVKNKMDIEYSKKKEKKDNNKKEMILEEENNNNKLQNKKSLNKMEIENKNEKINKWDIKKFENKIKEDNISIKTDSTEINYNEIKSKILDNFSILPINSKIQSRLLKVEINLEFEFPLNFIFTKNIIEDYNKIFSILFYIRKTKWKLKNIFLRLKNIKKNSQFQFYDKIDLKLKKNDFEFFQIIIKQFSALKNQSLNFVNSLQFHFESKILNNFLKNLENNFSKNNNLYIYKNEHEVFLKNLKNHFFLEDKSKTILNSILNILNLSDDIFSILQNFEDSLLFTNHFLSLLKTTNLILLKKKFVIDKSISTLIKTLINFKKKGFNIPLLELLTTANFNSYYY